MAGAGRAVGARRRARLDVYDALSAALVLHPLRHRERLPGRLRPGGHDHPGGDPRERLARGDGPDARLRGGGRHRHRGVDVETRVLGCPSHRPRAGLDRPDRLDSDRHRRLRHRQPDCDLRGLHGGVLPPDPFDCGGGPIRRSQADQVRAQLRRLEEADLGPRHLPGGAAAGLHDAAHQLLRRVDGGARRRDGGPEERRRHDRDPRARDVQPEPHHARHLHHRRHRLRGGCPAPADPAQGSLVETRMSSLVVSGVSKTWIGAKGLSVEAIRDASLRVASGEFVAILGPSGCGKSTLLELCAGLEKTTSGEIRIDGEPVDGPNPKAVMVFQEHALFPWLDVEANVGFGLRMRGIRDFTQVKEVLERVRLVKFARHYPHQLSGGMKQRVAIARALVGNPEFILMDEPFAALDFQTRVLMQQFLLEVWGGFRSTILFVTHQIDEAILLADRVVVMSAAPGRVLEEVTIALPRPRSMTDPNFNAYRVRLTSHMEREVTREMQELEVMRAAEVL